MPARKKSRVPKDFQPAAQLPGLSSRYNKPPSASSSSSSSSESEEEEEGWGGAYHVSRKEVEQGPYQPRRPQRDDDSKGKKKSARRKAKEDEEALLDVDPEQAELAEALRLQRLQRQQLDLDDFGSVAPLQQHVQPTPTAQQEQAAAAADAEEVSFESREDAIAHLLKTSPLLLTLLSDFQDQSAHASELRQAVQQMDDASPIKALQTLHLQVVESYLAVLAFWLKLHLEGQQESELGQRVFQRLTGLREGLQGLLDAGLSLDAEGEEELVLPGQEEDEFEFLDGSDDDDDDDEKDDQDEEDGDEGEEDERLQQLVQQRDFLKALEKQGLSLADLQEQDSDSPSEAEEEQEAPKPQKQRKRSRKRTSKSAPKKDDQLLNLNAAAPPEARDDFLEPQTLTSADASDKKAKKHSLRFHTSQIANTANRRSNAAEARRQGGDADVPYVSKEQLRRDAQRKASERQERDLRRAGQLDHLEQDHDVEPQQPNDGGYYDLVSNSKAAAKAAKQETYDAQKMADRAALSAEDSSAGPRAASRAILANKGLTPRRPKANRNPRVKKRLNFEKAQKKIGSQQRRYDAGKAEKSRAPGGYEGERSGINRRAVKSTKL